MINARTILALIAPFLVMPAQAQESGYTWIVDRHTYVLNAGGLWTGTFEAERKVHDAQSARNGARIDISWPASQQRFEILEAVTLKADGRRLPVGEDKIIDIAPQVAREVALYTDNRTRSIVFPDLAAGDSIRYVYRLTGFEASWRKFSWRTAWPGSVRTKLSERIIEGPIDLPIAVEHHGIDHRTQQTGERIRHIFSWRNDTIQPNEAGSTSETDWGRRFAISTFRSYTEIGDHYGRLHATAAVVVPEIAALADEITAATADRATQARLLFEWVTKNIRYVAVAVGSGKLTPTPAVETIRNRYGDCKAQVALLAALLSAKGIASEPALININVAQYSLPAPPVAWFDHVILYLPDFERYVEPTSQYAAFGILPWGHYDKPVLHAVEGKSRTSRVPRSQSEDHVAEVHTIAAIMSDGRVVGRTTETASGAMATDLKSAITADISRTKATAQLRFFGTPGAGKWTKWTRNMAGLDAWLIGEFTLVDEIDLEAGEALIAPAGLRFLVRPANSLLGTHDAVRLHPFPCHAGRQIETIDVAVPSGFRPARLPADRSWKTSIAEYKSSYGFSDGKLSVRREFVAMPEGQVCTPAHSRELVDLFSNIRRDYRSSVVFDKSS